MGMPASITGDMSIGHAFSPSPITPATATVTVMGVPPHVAGAVVGVHVLGTSAHAGTLLNCSTTVLIGGKGAARLMDTADCGAQIIGTAATVLIGG